MKTIFAIAALIVSVATASAQTTTTSTVREDRNRIVRTDADGSVTTTTARRDRNGTTYTHEHTPAPRRLADIMRDLPQGEAPRRAQRDGTWTGYEGSPRDVAWMEACRPTLVTDRHGMARYTYAKRGCETGDPQ